MIGRTVLFVTLLLSFDCGGANKAGPDTKAAAAQAVEARKCLRDAAALRKPEASAPERIKLSQILVRHAGLERPQGAKLTRAQACLKALDALKEVQLGTSWTDVVEQYSDSPGPKKDGDLGVVSKDDLDPEFANAAFALDTNELSYVVETKQGFHVILRTK